VLERIRERLAAVLIEATGPAFTVSFGVARGYVGLSFDVLVSAADKALLQAKVLGRDRVVVVGDDAPISDGELDAALAAPTR
jgi:PleD family two-component response regulator